MERGRCNTAPDHHPALLAYWWAYGIYCLMGIGLLYGGRWVARHWRTLIHIRARRISHYKLLSLLGKGGWERYTSRST